jgi:hypothetical protein
LVTVSERSSKPRPSTRLWSTARYLWRQARQAMEWGPGARRLQPDDIAALYLLLLARMPESEAMYRNNRRRRTGALMADMLRSGEFGDRILPVLLAQGRLPHERLGPEALGRARAWLERAGIGRAGPSSGWNDLLAILFTEKPAVALLPRWRPQQAPVLLQSAAEIRRSQNPVRSPANEADIRALYLLLLGHMPDGVAAYSGNQGRPRDDIIAELLASADFRDRVLLPLLLDLPIPQQYLDPAGLPAVRAWLTGIGLPPAGSDAGWIELFATLVLSEPVARLTAAVLPAYAARLRQEADRLRLQVSGDLPLDDADIDALYLLLLGRRPESDFVYRDRRGRRRGQLIADILGSPEFRDRMLARFLGLSQAPLAIAGLDVARAWVARNGVTLPPGATDWAGVAAAFLNAEPARSLVLAVMPGEADRLLRRAAVEAMRSAEERAEGAKAERLQTDLAALDRRLKELEAGWRQHVPAFLNAVSSVGAFAHQQARLQRELEALRGDLDTAARKAAE